MNYMDRITFDSEPCGGRPCIRGYRIRVKDILEMLAGGASCEEMLADFPDLEADDLTAARLRVTVSQECIVNLV